MTQPLYDQFKSIWFAPAFSSLLADRGELTLLAAAGALHLGLNLAGYPGWQCPILAATGVPCPGCGLTRAIVQLLHGNVSTAMQTHAFAPLFLVAILILFAVLLLPEKLRNPIISFVNRLEIRTGLTAWVLSLLMLYWAIRLIA